LLTLRTEPRQKRVTQLSVSRSHLEAANRQ